jgi:hypothetical protein
VRRLVSSGTAIDDVRVGTARRRRRQRRRLDRENAGRTRDDPPGADESTPARRPWREIEELWDELFWSDEPAPRPASLEALARLAEASRTLRQVERLWLASARAEGHPWKDIAAALGIAPSSARERLAGRPRRLTR